MIKKLSKIGDQWGLILEPALLEQLGVDEETEVTVELDGDALVVRAVKEDKRDRLMRAADELMDAHEETFRKLAQ